MKPVDQPARDLAYEAAAESSPHPVDRDGIDRAIDAYLAADVPAEAVEAACRRLHPLWSQYKTGAKDQLRRDYASAIKAALAKLSREEGADGE
jgi:hypothetical protein